MSKQAHLPRNTVTRLLSSGLVARGRVRSVDSAEPSFEGENRLLTILFCDLVGYFPRTCQLPSDEAAELLIPVLTVMADTIAENDGLVIRCFGDSILAVFGADGAREDDAGRATLAALALRVVVRPFGFEVRSGINSGLVYLGWSGGRHYREISLVGTPVDIAARLQSQAQPGEVLATGELFRNIDAKVKGTPRRLALKGTETPVNVYRLESLSPVKSRKQRVRHRLFGREPALAAISSKLTGLQKGLGHCVLLWGPAGVGKSRVISEIERRLTSTLDFSNFLWLQARWREPSRLYRRCTCKFHRRLFAGSPQSLVDTNARISLENESQPSRLSLKFLNRVISELIQSNLSFGFRTDSGSALRHSSNRGIELAIADCVEFISQQKPVILVLEDIHWASPKTLDIITWLMTVVSRTPLFVIGTARPGREYRTRQLIKRPRGSCRPLSALTEIYLDSLSYEDSHEMLKELSDAKLSKESAARIHEIADGNPLFLRDAFDSIVTGVSQPSVEGFGCFGEEPGAVFPPVIRRTVWSRIDRLDPRSRVVLQIASVIGQLFQKELLKEIVLRSVDLDRSLRVLEERRFVAKKISDQADGYVFLQLAVRQAAYESLLHRHRLMIHREIAKAIKRLYRSSLEDWYTLLVHHYEQADMPEKAAYYSRLVG